MIARLFLADPTVVPWAIFGGVALLVIAGIVAAVISERKRVQALQRLAEELGLAWYPQGQAATESVLRSFSFYDQGRGHQLYNLIHGQTDEAEIALFDFKFTTGSGKQQQTHQRTVALVRSPQLNLPRFSLQPEHFFHRVGKWFGMQDINFEEYPKFSKKYMLQGADEAAIRAVFTPALVAHLEEMPYAQLEARGDALALQTAATRRSVVDFKPLLEDAFAIYRILAG